MMNQQYPNQPGYPDPRQPGYTAQTGFGQTGYTTTGGGYQTAYSGPAQQTGYTGQGYTSQTGYAQPVGGAGQMPYGTPGAYAPNAASRPAVQSIPMAQSVAGGTPVPPQQGYGSAALNYTGVSSQTGYGGQQPGYMPQQPGYGNQNGYAPQTVGQQPGYAPQAGYAQQTGYAQQAGYAQQGGNAQQAGYSQQAGYAPQGGYSAQGQQPAAAQNNPYYQNHPGYQNGYGGYGEPQQPAKKPVDVRLPVTIGAVAAVALLVISLVTGLGALKWAAAAVALLSCAVMWVFPGVPENSRLTMTVILGAVMLVSLIGAVTGGTTSTVDPTNDPYGQSALGQSQQTAQTQTNAGSVYANTGAESLGALSSVSVTPEPTQEDTLQENDAVKQLQSFFYFWSVNNTNNMVALCSPSWQSSVENPMVDLYSTIANRKPLEWIVEKISGSENDTSRTVTVKAVIDKQNGRTSSTYRLSVLMVKENENWYVDPKSLKTSESVEEEATAEPTATPTAEPVISGNTILYYNPKGGSKYHTDPNCKIVGDKFKPLAGSFRYSQINDAEYASLSFCNVCNAPARPN